MTNMLYYAHSGLRYLVLLLGLLVILYHLYAFFTSQREGKPGRIMMSAFVGVLDLQILLGIVLVALGIYYPALIGHLAMMVLAAVVGHASAVMAKKSLDVRRAHGIRLLGAVVTMLLIAGGIMAIGRGLFESAVMTVGG